jgi:hypothetical protein
MLWTSNLTDEEQHSPGTFMSQCPKGWGPPPLKLHTWHHMYASNTHHSDRTNSFSLCELTNISTT